MTKFRNLTLRFSAVVALFLLAFTVQLAAQSIVSGDIAGAVKDPTGAVVPNAKVTLKSIDTGATQATTTNALGAYRFALLKPGRYSVTATAKGFRTTVVTTAVSIGQTAQTNIKLAIGQSSETVEVSSQLPLVQTDNGNTQTSYNTQQIASLPNPGGDITYVASTAPGIALNTSGGGGYGNFTSNGLPATSNSFTVNGTDEMDPYLNLNNSGASNLTLGANELSDATVTTNGYSGEYGRNAGAQINYTTKSGTNNYHGNAIFQYSGASMMARDWFANGGAGTQVYQPNPNSQDQQWAASIGGPIVKNKTFFFVDTEGLRYKLPTSTQVTMPSPYYQQGTLSGDPAFLDGIYNYYVANGFYGSNVPANNPYTPLPAAEIPFYQNMFNLYNNAVGASSAVPVAGNPYVDTFRSLATNTAHEWVLIGRIDENFSQNDKVFFRYKTDHGLQPTYTDPINPAFNDESVQPSYEGQVNWSHVFSPNMVNQFMASGSYYSAIFRSVNQSAATTLFPYNSYYNSDFTPLGGINFIFPQGRNVTQYQFIDDLSWTRGNHSFKFGVNFQRNDVSDYSYSEINVTPATGETDLGDYASGVWDFYLQNFPSRLSQPFSLFSLGMYAQDTWRVNNKLTLTLALRADHNGNPKCVTNCYSELTTTFDQLNHDATVPYNQIMQNGMNAAFRNLESIAWQPRFGFAYSPFGNTNTAIRGGFGIFSDLFPGDLAEFFSSNIPQVNQFLVFGGYADPSYPGSAQSDATAANTVFNQQYGNGGTYASISNALAAQNVPFFPPALNVIGSLNNAKYMKWNFEIEQALGTRNEVTVDYEGNHGYDLLMNNAGVNAYTTGTVPGFPTAPPDQRFGTVSEYSSTGRSNYNGLTLSFTRRYSQLTLNANYTWSHALDDISSVAGEPYSNNNSILSVINPYSPGANYANSDFDIRHYFSATYTYMPKAHFSNFWLDNLVNGWMFSQTFFVRSGLPFSVYNSGVVNSGLVSNYSGTLLANYTGGATSCNSPYHTCMTSANFVDPSVAGLTETTRRNAFRGPGYFDSDLNLTRSFKVREGMNFTLGANAFNVFNHPNFAAPVADLASSQFGTIQSTVAPPTSPFGAFAGVASGRILQVKAAFNF